MPSYTVNPFQPNQYDFNSIVSLLNLTGYSGEYMVDLDYFHWMQDYPSVGNSIRRKLARSFSIEVVGFPFSMNCIYSNLGCADGLASRALEMPANPLIANAWGANLWRKFDFPIPPWVPGNGPTIIGGDLASYAFLFQHDILGQQPFFPHTILKHTIYLHCGTSINNPKIDSISFFYDNTRGRMRLYPFTATNTVNTNPYHYDVIFIPRILYKPWGHLYGEITNDDIYISGKTPNYFDNFASQTCNGINITGMGGNYFFDPNTSIFNFAHPAEYSLLSSLLYSERYPYCLAGYDPVGNLLSLKPNGIKHNYFVQSNFDLTLINPTDLTIYNPSEVTITATNLVFPSGYTFKTIRGVYPTEAQVMADDTYANGGPFGDLRDVPVKTDLTTENTNDVTNFPLSAQAATKHLYASRYYLDNATVPTVNPMLTIEPCVKLFDCTFDVYPGGTLQFDEYPSNLGKEDHSTDHNDTRYKIQTLGGAVLRNFARVQYLQNGDITQQAHLHYKATDEIIAGHFVDTDTDVPPGDYTFKNGANVTLQATNVIRLTDGFNVRSGAAFHAYTASPGTPVSNCTTPDNNRKAGSQQAGAKHKLEFLNLSIQPNPTPNKIKLMQFNLPVKAQQLEIIDSFGRMVFEKQEYNGASDLIDLSHQPNGLYIARCITNGEAHQVKFVVNK